MLDSAAISNPLLPECLDGRLTMKDFSNTDAVKFEPNTWEYYKDRTIPLVLPGAIFGIIALVIFFLFLFWFIWHYCTCCCRACCRKKAKVDSGVIPQETDAIKSYDAPEQMGSMDQARSGAVDGTVGVDGTPTAAITSSSSDAQAVAVDGTIKTPAAVDSVAPAASQAVDDAALKTPTTADAVTTSASQVADDLSSIKPPPELGPAPSAAEKLARKHKKWNTCEKILIAVFTLATLGVGIWGIVASLTNTDSQISRVWEIVGDIEMLVDNTTQTLNAVNSDLKKLQVAVGSLQGQQGLIETAVGNSITAPTGETGQQLINVSLALLQQGADGFNVAQAGIDQAAYKIDTYIGQTVDGIEADYKPPSMEFQNTGRVIIIVVIFVIIIIAAMLAGLLSYLMVSPRTAGISVLFLWFCIFLLFLLGAGVIRGLVGVTNDTCMYAETLTIATIMQKIQDPTKQLFVLAAVKYYMDPTPPPLNQTLSDGLKAIANITGLDLQDVQTVVQNSQLSEFATAVNQTDFQTAVANSSLAPKTKVALKTIADTVPELRDDLRNLDALNARENTYLIYEDLKSLACCDGYVAAQNIAVAWTVCGVIASVLGLLCIWRIFAHRRRKAAAAKNGLL